MNSWLLEHLVCPRHHTPLTWQQGKLVCREGCIFPVIEGVPVMLLEEAKQTIDLASASLRIALEGADDNDLYVETLGLSSEEKLGILHMASHRENEIDPVVSYLVAATNGIAYKNQIGRLKNYPIPDLRTGSGGGGRIFLDIGCSWGRWCFAASKLGYKVIGIDPSLGAVMAAKRVAKQLGLEAFFVVGDARYLPFRSSCIDHVFSYSVLQHLSRPNVVVATSEIARVLKQGGTGRVQMPNQFGLRCLYHQARRGFREAKDFEVRYWFLPSLKKLFTKHVGKTNFEVDCFFGIGLQFSDIAFMTPLLKVVVTISEVLRIISRYIPALVWCADSIYVISKKRAPD